MYTYMFYILYYGRSKAVLSLPLSKRGSEKKGIMYIYNNYIEHSREIYELIIVMYVGLTRRGQFLDVIPHHQDL